jgi:DNA primase small subunit
MVVICDVVDSTRRTQNPYTTGKSTGFSCDIMLNQRAGQVFHVSRQKAGFEVVRTRPKSGSRWLALVSSFISLFHFPLPTTIVVIVLKNNLPIIMETAVTSTNEENDVEMASVVVNSYVNDSSHNNNVKTSSSTPSSSTQTAAVVFTPELLKVYYARLFPFALMYQWLSYDPKVKLPTTKAAAANSSSPTSTATTTTIITTSSRSHHHNKASSSSSLFHHREFSFTLQTATKDEIYLRYQCFTTMEAWQQAMVQKNPIKIDLGAMYTLPPSHKHTASSSSAFQPVQRELVLDIDVSDYDDIRHCGCRGASQMCPTCWHYLDMSQDVLDVTLRNDFGFQHVAWFYSGRRGVHAWICDARARQMSNAARGALASYLEVRSCV